MNKKVFNKEGTLNRNGMWDSLSHEIKTHTFKDNLDNKNTIKMWYTIFKTCKLSFSINRSIDVCKYVYFIRLKKAQSQAQ